MHDPIRQGQVRWLERPERKRRPVLIVTRDGPALSLSEVLVIPLTTRQRDLPTEIELGPDDGLARTSFANAQQIGEVSRSLLREQVGQLAPGRWYEVCDAIAIAIGC